MQDNLEHSSNHFHSLMLELQEAKKHGHIFQIQFVDHNLLILMSRDTDHSKVHEVAEYISKKYRVYTEASLTSPSIVVFDVFMLDPRV